MTKQEIIEKLKTELDINQRLFLAHRFHSTQFNDWFEKSLTEFEQAVREEIYKRGYADGKNEQPYGINKDVSIN